MAPLTLNIAIHSVCSGRNGRAAAAATIGTNQSKAGEEMDKLMRRNVNSIACFRQIKTRAANSKR